MTFEGIKSLYNCSAMPTYSRFELALKSGKGATAYDCKGKKYIDFTSGIGVNSLGWCDQGWVEAISRQASLLTHTSNLFYNEATAVLTKKLTELTGFSKAFLANSGAEANECAIKLARKASFDKFGQDRFEIITFNDSFHGRTMSTLTATAQNALHPKCFAPYNDGFVYCDKNIESVSNAITPKTCAIMLEMIQGEGGVIPMDRSFVQDLFTLANKNDIVVIVDEVQTGISRTGKLCAFEHFGIKPDIITLAKGLGGGLPIGACLCSEELAETMSVGSHGSTFGGNPVVCAGASYVLDKVSDGSFLDSVTKKGEYIRNKVLSFKNIKSVRGLGLMIGIEVADKTGKDIACECIENGLMVLTAKNLVRLLPPLNITESEIDEGLMILKRIIEK